MTSSQTSSKLLNRGCKALKRGEEKGGEERGGRKEEGDEKNRKGRKNNCKTIKVDTVINS